MSKWCDAIFSRRVAVNLLEGSEVEARGLGMENDVLGRYVGWEVHI